MTGATGDLTPDEVQRDFEPGEWREAVDPAHYNDVTEHQAAQAPAQAGEVGEPGADRPDDPPTNMATRESGYGSEHGLSPNDPAYRMELHTKASEPSKQPRETRIGGDEIADHDEHL